MYRRASHSASKLVVETPGKRVIAQYQWWSARSNPMLRVQRGDRLPIHARARGPAEKVRTPFEEAQEGKLAGSWCPAARFSHFERFDVTRERIPTVE